MHDFSQFILIFALLMLVMVMANKIRSRNQTIKTLSESYNEFAKHASDTHWKTPLVMTEEELQVAIDKTLAAVAHKPRSRGREIRMAMWGVYSVFTVPRTVSTIHGDPKALED